MTTTKTSVEGRPAVLDRFVTWVLDTNGEIYGDERERLRWYEGMAAATQLQLIAMPCAAAVLVLVLGRPAVLPLAVLLGILYLSSLLTLGYVKRRSVDTAIARWTRIRVVLALLGIVPYFLFVLASVNAYRGGSTTTGALVGGCVGIIAAVIGLALDGRRRRRREAAVLPDVD
jgi:hypothetical protein